MEDSVADCPLHRLFSQIQWLACHSRLKIILNDIIIFVRSRFVIEVSISYDCDSVGACVFGWSSKRYPFSFDHKLNTQTIEWRRKYLITLPVERFLISIIYSTQNLLANTIFHCITFSSFFHFLISLFSSIFSASRCNYWICTLANIWYAVTCTELGPRHETHCFIYTMHAI